MKRCTPHGVYPDFACTICHETKEAKSPAYQTCEAVLKWWSDAQFIEDENGYWFPKEPEFVTLARQTIETAR